ncbi:MAG: hypothetical protein QMD44_08355 [Thermodesulfovibrionales bacterium]|jgi:hypothetical protein|nr:hypothetical protein [Thermodesulfovibrionales bacterium]RJR10505.1 MAG: hypothetical protein C4588_03150 [Candidatus Parcubacteria bacterium]
MRRLILIFIFLLFANVSLFCYAYAYQYNPPTSSYKVENLKTIDQPYNITWGFVEKAITKGGRAEVLEAEKNKISGIIQVVLKDSTSFFLDDLLDCGQGEANMKFKVYPKEIVFEIKLNSVSNTQTLVSINLKNVRGGWQGHNSAYAYLLDDNLDAKCISKGEYENKLWKNIQNQIAYLKYEEEKKKREEEEQYHKKALEEQRKKQEEERQRQEQERRQKTEEEKKAMELEWKKAGFNSDEMNRWMNGGFNLSAAKFLKSKCPKGPGSLEDFFYKNPYDFEGKCYRFRGTNIQTISKTQALFEGSRLSLIDFAPESTPNLFYEGYVKGIGVFKYTAVRGDLQIVPHFKAIRLPKNKSGNK